VNMIQCIFNSVNKMLHRDLSSGETRRRNAEREGEKNVLSLDEEVKQLQPDPSPTETDAQRGREQYLSTAHSLTLCSIPL
jgi:hypothetical protein